MFMYTTEEQAVIIRIITAAESGLQVWRMLLRLFRPVSSMTASWTPTTEALEELIQMAKRGEMVIYHLGRFAQGYGARKNEPEMIELTRLAGEAQRHFAVASVLSTDFSLGLESLLSEIDEKGVEHTLMLICSFARSSELTAAQMTSLPIRCFFPVRELLGLA